MKKILFDFLIGLVIVGGLLAGKMLIENSRYGPWFNVRGYEILHFFISVYDAREDLPVVVLDISDLERDREGKVSAERLREIVEALIESRAKAIAIDVDFSPRVDRQNPANTGPRSEDDEEFFGFLHQQKTKGVPVFVGTHSNIGAEPETWLGLEDYKDLAADMTLMEDDTTKVPAWLQCDENIDNKETKLRSISRALADAYPTHPSPPSLLKDLLEDPDSPENLKDVTKSDNNDKPVVCKRAFTFVNYAKLELIQKLTLQTLDRNAVFQAKNIDGYNKFSDKLVILGNGQQDTATDKFNIIGRNKSVAGVYLHASTAYTLVADPIYKFKHHIIIFLDLLLGLFVIVGLLLVRIYYRNDDGFSHHKWENRFVLLSIIITLVTGLLMVKLFNILWLDFSLVVFALLLHSKVQNGLASLLRKIFGRKSSASGSNMKIGILIALLTILLVPEIIQAQRAVPRAVVISIKGKALIKRNKSTREENLPNGATLYTADRIKCDKGCVDLKISYCNIYPKPIARGPSWTTILALNCGAKPDGTRGGAPKGEGIAIISPRESEVIRPEEFSLRWEPDRSVPKVDINVKIHLGEDVWSQKGVDGSKGTFESDDLRAKLKEKQMNKELVFDVTLSESKNNNERNSENKKQRVTFRLISHNDQEKLTNGLKVIEGEPDRILKAIGRGLEFNEYQLYSNALREIEQALETAYDQKSDEKTIAAIQNLAILMNFQAYNDARVEQLCSSQRRSRSFLRPCVLIGKKK